MTLALLGGTIYVTPDDAAIRDGVVLIDGDTIAAVGDRAGVRIPPAAQAIDCAGLTIAAGFWNSHVHFFERKWADAATIPAAELARQLDDAFLRFGFTSVFDIGSMFENTRRLRERIESGEVAGPRIRTTGEGLVPPGALPPDLVVDLMGVMKFPAPEVADAAQAAAAARALLDRGADGIKLFPSSPRGAALSPGAMEAAVAAAHAAGKPVFVHPNNGDDVAAALRAGVDVIAHTTPRSGAWSGEIIELMAERRAALTPTLALWRYYARHDRLSAQEKLVDAEIAQLRAWHSAGGAVLFGTDLGAVGYDPAEEYALMERAGMSFRQILASLTTAPAARFGESHRLGRIAAGMLADIVVFHETPSDVRITLRDGEIVTSRS